MQPVLAARVARVVRLRARQQYAPEALGIESEVLAHVAERERPSRVVRTYPCCRLPDEAAAAAVAGGEAADGILQDREQERLLTTDQAVVARRSELRGEEVLGHEQRVSCMRFR